MENILLHKIAGVEMAAESFLGSDCTGSDGDENRVLTTSISYCVIFQDVTNKMKFVIS